MSVCNITFVSNYRMINCTDDITSQTKHDAALLHTLCCSPRLWTDTETGPGVCSLLASPSQLTRELSTPGPRLAARDPRVRP